MFFIRSVADDLWLWILYKTALSILFGVFTLSFTFRFVPLYKLRCHVIVKKFSFVSFQEKSRHYSIEDSIKLDVPHCMQNYNWDCGLACASMVLLFLGKDASKVYTSDLEDLKCGESIWTIDLAALMRMYSIKHALCTVTLGVDHNYTKQAYYSRSFAGDEERVSRLFKEASTNGLCVQQRSVSKQEIEAHLEMGNIIIVLVDWNLLECIWCDRWKCKTKCFSCISKSCCGDYQGHYVVLCGLDKKKNRFLYKNPAYDEEICCSTMDKFEAARTSYGTDEDILFIFRDVEPYKNKEGCDIINS